MSLDLLTAPLLVRDDLVHAFTTRAGGVSEGAYASLNMTRSRGDSAEHVATNRTRVRQALGLDYLAFAIQVHGNAVVRVDAAPRGDQAAGEADAMITDRPGIGLVCQTADCTPILLFDPKRRAVAAIHSGWRSTVLDIAGETVAALVREYGTGPADLIAAIGPSISAANYRVGPEVVVQFEAIFADTAGILISPDEEGGARLDVGEACRRQLIAAGIPARQIERSDLCTYAEEPRLFSARRAHHRGQSGVFGGQAGIIGLR